MKLTKRNTITVAILTETGTSFTEEGVDYVKGMIVEKHPEMKRRPVIALMGDIVKYPKNLLSLSETNDDLFIAVSYDGGNEIRLFTTPKGIDYSKFIKKLKETAIWSPKMTSWELFTGKGGEHHA